jgi:hypothetical protein
MSNNTNNKNITSNTHANANTTWNTSINSNTSGNIETNKGSGTGNTGQNINMLGQPNQQSTSIFIM